MFGLWPLLLQRGMRFAETSTRARVTIAELGSRFLHNNCVVLTHGYSRVVLALLQRAVAQVGICDGLTGSACVCSALTLPCVGSSSPPPISVSMRVCVLCTQGTNFSVIVTEGRPDATGLKTVKALDEMGIPTTLILDSGAAYAMDR